MSRSGSMRDCAATVESSHFTGSHAAYRQYLESSRLLLLDVALLLMEDSARTADWHRDRSSGRGLGVWLQTFFLSLRMRSHGRLASEAVLEAAKDIVKMATVHQEYMHLEARANASSTSPASTTIGGPARYRTEVRREQAQ